MAQHVRCSESCSVLQQSVHLLNENTTALYICIEGLKITGGLATDPYMVHDWDAISNNKSTTHGTAGNTIQWSNQFT